MDGVSLLPVFEETASKTFAHEVGLHKFRRLSSTETKVFCYISLYSSPYLVNPQREAYASSFGLGLQPRSRPNWPTISSGAHAKQLLLGSSHKVILEILLQVDELTVPS